MVITTTRITTTGAPRSGREWWAETKLDPLLTSTPLDTQSGSYYYCQ